MIECVGCDALVADTEGPVHRYLEASPGCWAAYGEVLAREYSDLAYFRTHRLTVDAYSAQHPGGHSPQALRSVCVHLVSLCLVLEHRVEPQAATGQMQRFAKFDGFRRLVPPVSRGRLHVTDVLRAKSAVEHRAVVADWAVSVWTSWAHQHDIVREWVEHIAPSDGWNRAGYRKRAR